jgi:hypothetical protein
MKFVSDLSPNGRSHRPRSCLPQPALRLDFTTDTYHPGGFGPMITFTRAGSARYHDASGVMQVAAVNTPRIDHDRGTGTRRGFLVEGPRTNIFLQSATPATQSVTVTAQLYSLSFWGTGSITLSGAHTATLNGSGPNTRAVLIFTPTAGALTLTVSGEVQLAQLEPGNCATSYIQTMTAATTRLADVAVLPLGFWWNPNEGTMLVEWQDINMQSGNTRIIGMDALRSIQNLAGAIGPGLNNANQLQMWNGSVAFSAQPGPVIDLSKGIQKGVAAWSGAGRSVAIRNTLATTPTLLFNTGSPTELNLGAAAGGSGAINGCLRRITYYARRLPDAQLLSLVP